jgi:hypothetical protein
VQSIPYLRKWQIPHRYREYPRRKYSFNTSARIREDDGMREDIDPADFAMLKKSTA